jgi:hypothetical protein
MTEAYAVVERWAQTFNEGDADATAALYAPGATIWGTLAQYLTTSPADIRTYFMEAARAGLRVRLQPHVLSPTSETSAIDAGHYEFARTTDGQTFPALQLCAGEAERRVDDRASAFILPAQAHRRLARP